MEVIGSACSSRKPAAIQGLLPVPQRENRLLLGQPGEAVLSLLRLRRARHGAALPHGARPHGLLQAVEELASRLGLEVPREAGAAAGAERDSEKLYDLMSRVAKFYAEALSREPRAREYLTRRGLTADTIAQFGIGYAPDPGTAC